MLLRTWSDLMFIPDHNRLEKLRPLRGNDSTGCWTKCADCIVHYRLNWVGLYQDTTELHVIVVTREICTKIINTMLNSHLLHHPQAYIQIFFSGIYSMSPYMHPNSYPNWVIFVRCERFNWFYLSLVYIHILFLV